MQANIIYTCSNSEKLKQPVYQNSFRIVIVTILSVFWSLLNTSIANAQQTPIPPSLNPNETWCTTFTSTEQISGSRLCGFSDPHALCEFAMQNVYPKDTDILRDVVVSESGQSVLCKTDPATIRSRGRLWFGNLSGNRGCEGGRRENGGQCSPLGGAITNSCPNGGPQILRGNPIDLLSGIKIQTVQDYSTADGRFTFNRSYASRSYGRLNDSRSGILGRGWSIGNLPRLSTRSRGQANLFLPSHQALSVICSSLGCNTRVASGALVAGAPRAQLDDSDSRFIPDITQAQNTIPFIDSGNVKYIFKSEEHDGKIYYAVRRIEYPGGYSIDYETRLIAETIANLDVTEAISPVRFIVEKMTDSFGRSMIFEYDQETWINSDFESRKVPFEGEAVAFPETVGLLKRVVLPDLSILHFKYDSVTDFGQEWNLSERLNSVYRTPPTYIDGEATPIELRLSSETYHYENNLLPFAMTGITDSAGIRYASWEYSDDGLAISSEHAGGIDRYDFEYDIPEGQLFFGPTVTETNPLGRNTIYRSESLGRYFNQIDGQASANCVPDAVGIRNITARIETVDKEGRETIITKNDRGWTTSKTVEVDGTAELISSTTWHPVYRLPLQSTMPSLTTNYTYDDEGRMLLMTQTDTSTNPDAPRTWTFTHVGPHVSSVDGPLPGAADTQTFEYNAEKLTAVTNELGHKTLITAHNPNGAPTRLEDPNGNVTVLAYDSKHRLTGIVESQGDLNAQTQLTYDPNDLLLSVTQPNGSALYFEYDDARRLMGIRNSVDERIDYTRNNMGGITATEISGLGTGITFEISQVTDELNRVIKTATVGGAAGLTSETSLGYDREHNLTSINDPRQNNWQQSYDGLNRLVKEIDPLGAETDYGLSNQYDARNPLSSVKDARNVITNYVRNGYGEVIRGVSLEAGITEYTRDTRGLVTQMTDARGVVTDYTYDDVGRLLTETYPSEPASDIIYAYDEGPNGIGELTTVTESFGATGYTYNSLGQMTGMTRTINGQAYATAYTYDLAGEVLTETYPSGRTIRMTRDAAARITAIEAQGPGETEFTPLLSNVTYQPFGPISGASFGDGHQLNLKYDTAYRAKSLTRTTAASSLMDIDFEHDASGNILAMNDNVRPERSQSFTYDPVSRLTSAQNTVTGGYGSIGYDYNLVGDRTARNYTPIDGSLQAQIYNYAASTARLTDVTYAGSTLRLFGYDDSGQVISDTRSDDVVTSIFDYGLNARGRLSTVSEDGTLAATYTYDMSEQRIVKAVSGQAAIHYHYDGEGRLISETDAATGTTLREYIWLGLTPIASYGSSYDPDDPANDNCDPALIEALTQRLIDVQGRQDFVNDRLESVQGSLDARTTRHAFVETRLTGIESILEGVPETNVIRIDALTARIANLEPRLANLAAIIERLTARVADLEARDIRLIEAVANISGRIERLNTRCDTEGGLPADTDADTGTTVTGSNTITLSFLHSDHLGRPKFATRADGRVSWDGGITTPFGIQITALAAQTQAFMFPGQYADAETTGAGVSLSHNWHRTYDPMLGRYLQADPIELAGGLNRYAYVGGNPLKYVDPMGLKCMGLGNGCMFGPRDPVTGQFTFIEQPPLLPETVEGMNSVVPALMLNVGNTGTPGALTSNFCKPFKRFLGQQGPVFGQTGLGKSTRTGFLNSGPHRLGFTAHGNRAVFRYGRPGNHNGTPLFSTPRLPTPNSSPRPPKPNSSP